MAHRIMLPGGAQQAFRPLCGVAILLNTSEQNPGTLIQIRGPKRRKQNSRQPENVRRTGLCAFDLDRCVR
jgi:hypothetical protein